MLQIPVAKVAVLAATFAFDRPYTYKIPQPLTDTLRPGCRGMVPFSRGNRPCEGMVLALDQAQDDPKLKPITRQLDPEPILSPELIRLAIWMHDRFFCTIYDALHAILPAGVWYRVSTVYCVAPELDADAALTQVLYGLALAAAPGSGGWRWRPCSHTAGAAHWRRCRRRLVTMIRRVRCTGSCSKSS